MSKFRGWCPFPNNPNTLAVQDSIPGPLPKKALAKGLPVPYSCDLLVLDRKFEHAHVESLAPTAFARLICGLKDYSDFIVTAAEESEGDHLTKKQLLLETGQLVLVSSALLTLYVFLVKRYETQTTTTSMFGRAHYPSRYDACS